MKYRYALVLLLGLTACTNPAKEAPAGTYYDLKTYIEKQISELQKQKPTVVKRAGFGEEEEQQTTKDIDWSRELDLFLQADINKQAYQTSYQKSRPDSLTYEYTLKSTERLPVRFLRIELDSVTHQPRRIKATLRTKNSLYESERNVWLETEKGRIKQYHIDGFQQLAWLDAKPFSVEGNIK
ncbi:hypothetical protein LX87_00088 [Larkinella arboricola]|uniref:Lipoprotein n=1 Tax=Larkinella arboricola TaxID=643671 RepID=A0A327X7C7_LARAB|nr:hypothetical protein [Larkinella arboricola]RAK01974.1 hypothetical protein LX87_00088 [Larkinella arboricola]